MEVVRMRGDFGEMLFVVPTLHGLPVVQKLIGIIHMVAIAVDANLKRIASDQFSAHFKCKLAPREWVRVSRTRTAPQ